jgi:Glyoxalase/Bleomycin resistance protein/Dioxygenase superfamily
MITQVDRVQQVVADRSRAAAAYQRLLGAEIARADRLNVLSARRTVLRLGTGEIELLEPDGVGPVADFLSQTKGGLFAAGFAAPNIGKLQEQLSARGVPIIEEAGQLFLSPPATALPGLRAVFSPEANRTVVGLLRGLYEVTLLAQDYRSVVEQTATRLGLEASHFVPIRSPEFGYEGVLTLFHPERLDRIEIITPVDPLKTMGRFFAKRGPSPYMCYAEADDLAAIRSRLLEHAANDWTGPRDVSVPDNLFIHPKALAGLMLGVSRTTFAWTWSGHPERVRPGGLR